MSLKKVIHLIFRKEEESWESRLVVDDPKMKFFRVLPATEDSHSSNQLDRLGEMLKDSPKKISLRRKQAPVIPPLHVVSKAMLSFFL